MGFLSLRNDNPVNIIVKKPAADAMELKEKANEFIKEKKIFEAIDLYLEALTHEKIEKDLKTTILSNLSECFLILALYDDALKFAQKALELDEKHFKSLLRKARSLGYLKQFDEANEVLKKVTGQKKTVAHYKKFLAALSEQLDGNYSKLSDKNLFPDDQDILNYAKNVQIKHSEGKGRGLFATEDIPIGTTVIVERPIAIGKGQDGVAMLSVSGV